MPDRQDHRVDLSADFEVFYRAQYPTVARIAFGILRDEHLAEDVAQEVLISAQRRFAGSYGDNHARAWVRIASSHTALNALRAQRRRHARQRRDVPLYEPSDPGDVVVANERAGEVRAVLAQLPRHAATVLVLRHSGLSYAEVADAMDVRVDQVGTMLRRAEARFRKEIDRATRS